MGIEWSSVVAAPRQEVFTWFERPGAFARLAPPWQPVDVRSETESLADGRAVLGLPGGLSWVVPWRHTHEFEVVDADHTRMVDRVDSPAPRFALRSMFAYRSRQLSDDLAAHRLAAVQGLRPSVVAVTGAHGLVGSALTAFLTSGGHTVIRLVRHAPTRAGERRWDPADPDQGLLAGADAVVHLAGASIAGRFTEAHKHAIAGSRIEPTRRLAELAARSGVLTFVSASAIGLYGADRGDEQLTENSSRGTGFLADLVVDWEAAAATAADRMRVVTVRTGIVQSPRGGTLRLLRPLFAAGLGGRIGDGRQWLSWIGIDDLVDIYHRALWDADLVGPVNAVAPQPVSNADYTRTLARVLHRPALLPVPGFAPALLLGTEGARELAAASQRVQPARLQDAGHRFRTPELDFALRHILGRTLNPRTPG